MVTKKFKKGALIAAFCAVCWGLSGNAGQYLMQDKGFSADWLVSLRLTLSGLFLVIGGIFKYRKQAFDVFKSGTSVKALFIFSVFGTMAVQYTYFLTINYTNAATGTVLQYTSPVMIIIYLAVKNKKIPNSAELLSVFLAVTGTFLIATHGDFQSLNISPIGLVIGIISAVTLAFYTIYPVKILNGFSSVLISGWSMLFAGILLSLITRPFFAEVELSLSTVSAISFIILFGTMVPFALFLMAIRFIGSAKASLFSSIEPLTSTLFSVLFMDLALSFFDIVGFASIIITIFILYYSGNKK